MIETNRVLGPKIIKSKRALKKTKELIEEYYQTHTAEDYDRMLERLKVTLYTHKSGAK